MSRAMQDVQAERERQQVHEFWTVEHDDQHSPGELMIAACCYALAEPGGSAPDSWPWDEMHWKPKDTRRNLVRAAALLVAEIERMDRAAERAASDEPPAA
jgi:hypothetical protein